MPNLKKSKPRPWVHRRKVQEGRKRDNQAFYNSSAWRNTSRSYREDNPLCEVYSDQGRTVAAQMVDHLIRIEDGGSPFDPANLMAMSHQQHNRKSGMERHKGILIKTKKNSEGELIPFNRSDIFKVLNKG